MSLDYFQFAAHNTMEVRVIDALEVKVQKSADSILNLLLP